MRSLGAAILGVLLCAAAPVPGPALAPQDVVAAFCRQDAGGGLTDSDGFHAMGDLFTWPDGPGWDAYTVIRGWRALSVRANGRKAQAVVEYEVVGVLTSAPAFKADKKTERTIFRLVRSDRKHEISEAGEERVLKTPWTWRIQEPQDQPHVSVETAARMLGDWAKDGDARQKADAPRVLRALRAAADSR